MTLRDTPYFLGNSSRTHSPKTFKARSAHPSPTPSTETGHGVLGPRLGSEAHQDSSSSLFVTALSLPPAFCQIGTGFSFAERFLVGQEHRVLHAAVPLRTASLVGKLELAKNSELGNSTAASVSLCPRQLSVIERSLTAPIMSATSGTSLSARRFSKTNLCNRVARARL